MDEFKVTPTLEGEEADKFEAETIPKMFQYEENGSKDMKDMVMNFKIKQISNGYLLEPSNKFEYKEKIIYCPNNEELKEVIGKVIDKKLGGKSE